MSQVRPAKIPVIVWIAALGGLFFVALGVGFMRDVYNLKPPHRDFWRPDRLERIEENGVIMVGSSLTREALFYDGDFDLLAKESGLDLEFVRFSLNGGHPKKFSGLIEDIGKYRPRWVFLHAESFFMSRVVMNRSDNVTINNILRRVEPTSLYRNINFLYEWSKNMVKHYLFGMEVAEFPRHTYSQEDEQRVLEMVGTKERLVNYKVRIMLRPPVFPAFVESFIEEAKSRDIRVVLLETNRSKEANELLSPEFKSKIDDTLQQVSLRYEIPRWRFRGDLPFDHYRDRAHMNRRGRGVFSEWFISKLAEEY